MTLLYRAPEILLGGTVYSTPVDLWSIGCIFAELVNGVPVFQGDSEVFHLEVIFGCPHNICSPILVNADMLHACAHLRNFVSECRSPKACLFTFLCTLTLHGHIGYIMFRQGVSLTTRLPCNVLSKRDTYKAAKCSCTTTLKGSTDIWQPHILIVSCIKCECLS